MAKKRIQLMGLNIQGRILRKIVIGPQSGEKNNPERTKELAKKYQDARRDKAIAECRRWRKNNPNYSWEYKKRRLMEDPGFRVSCNLRNRLNAAIKRGTKRGSAVRDLGCSIKELKEYLENKFTDGMTWDNYGEWHIDHIKPLSSFDLNGEQQLKQACHYTNLQPLWAEDNIKKGDKIFPNKQGDKK